MAGFKPARKGVAGWTGFDCRHTVSSAHVPIPPLAVSEPYTLETTSKQTQNLGPQGPGCWDRYLANFPIPGIAESVQQLVRDSPLRRTPLHIELTQLSDVMMRAGCADVSTHVSCVPPWQRQIIRGIRRKTNKFRNCLPRW